MSTADEDLVASLLATALSLSFEQGNLQLDEWGKADRYCCLGDERYLIAEIERGQKHPTTNVVKLWPWLQRHSSASVVLAHAFIEPNDIPESRVRLACWLGAKMEREFPGRFIYRRLVVRQGTIREGLGELAESQQALLMMGREGTPMPFSPVWDTVRDHFFGPASLSRVAAITKAETQAEGWYKAELIWLLGDLQARGVIRSWAREHPAGQGRKKIDFKIELAGTSGLVELKTTLCGIQKGATWELPDYVMAAKSGYILSDVLKLAATEAPNRFLVVFAHAAPPSSHWEAVLSAIRKKAPRLTVTLPRLDESSSTDLSIGWLRVG